MKEQEPLQFCWNCRHGAMLMAGREGDRTMECRRFPPASVAIVAGGITTRFPTVVSEWVCGEFQSRPVPRSVDE